MDQFALRRTTTHSTSPRRVRTAVASDIERRREHPGHADPLSDPDYCTNTRKQHSTSPWFELQMSWSWPRNRLACIIPQTHCLAIYRSSSSTAPPRRVIRLSTARGSKYMSFPQQASKAILVSPSPRTRLSTNRSTIYRARNKATKYAEGWHLGC